MPNPATSVRRAGQAPLPDRVRCRFYNAAMQATPVAIESVTGPAMRPYLEDVARLRIAVFRDWPYLYEGDPGYERDYLSAYAASHDSVLVLARDGDTIVGASTGIPLADETGAYRAPFEARGIDPARVFHCGESVLLPGWRGRGIGHAFFDRREAHARRFGRFDSTAFCAVDRDDGDTRRPSDARDNTAFWRKRGYVRQPGMTMRLDWNEIGTGDATHALTFWLRPLKASQGTPS